MDGTLIRIEQPSSFPNSYYSQKGFYALNMLAVCDWSYCFGYIQVRDIGNTHDSMAFLDLSMYSDILSSQLNLNQNNINYKILTDSRCFIIVDSLLHSSWIFTPLGSQIKSSHEIEKVLGYLTWDPSEVKPKAINFPSH